MIEPINTYGTRSIFAARSPAPSRSGLNRRLWLADRAGESHRLVRAVSKLVSLASLPKGWDSYDAEPPSEEALRSALKALGETWRVLRPVEVVPSVEGGVTLVYADDERGYAEIEFGNDGEVVAALRGPDGAVDTWNVDKEFGTSFALKQFRRRLRRGV